MVMASSAGNLDNDGGHFGDAAAVARLTTLINRLALDCECRSRLDEALVRFGEWENMRIRRRELSVARASLERIGAIFPFLDDLNELRANELDRSVYLEMALLFDEIADLAVEGARDLRHLSAPRS